jgi:hypothetical protein
MELQGLQVVARPTTNDHALWSPGVSAGWLISAFGTALFNKFLRR